MAVYAVAPVGELSEPTAPVGDDGETIADVPEETASDPMAAKDEISTSAGTDQISDENGGDTADEADSQRRTRRKPPSPVALASILGAVFVAVVVGLSGYLGYQAYQLQQQQHLREIFVQGARQGALNLTTIDWQHADADVQRILDSATGTFYDDFSNRSQPFIDVVRQTQSRSVGTITEAGLESSSGDEAQVLVAVTVKIANAAGPEQDPRRWRMRITTQKVGNEAKVSNVAFVP